MGTSRTRRGPLRAAKRRMPMLLRPIVAIISIPPPTPVLSVNRVVGAYNRSMHRQTTFLEGPKIDRKISDLQCSMWHNVCVYSHPSISILFHRCLYLFPLRYSLFLCMLSFWATVPTDSDTRHLCTTFYFFIEFCVAILPISTGWHQVYTWMNICNINCQESVPRSSVTSTLSS